MADTVSNIDAFHKTRKGRLVFGAIELVISYLVISLAIDTGSIWEWLIGFLLLIGGFNNLVRTLGRQAKKDDHNKAKAK